MLLRILLDAPGAPPLRVRPLAITNSLPCPAPARAHVHRSMVDIFRRIYEVTKTQGAIDLPKSFRPKVRSRVRLTQGIRATRMGSA